MTYTPEERFKTGRFIDVGKGLDIDEAFEDASDNVRELYGSTGIIPSVAGFSVSEIVETKEEASFSLAAAKIEAARDKSPLSARTYAADNKFKRRKAVVKSEELLPFLSAQELTANQITPELEEILVKALATEGKDKSASEFIEAVEIRSTRPRFKPVSVSIPVIKEERFAVRLEGDSTILAKGPTATVAKREALKVLKEGAFKGAEEYTLEVSLTSPLIKVTRQKVAQKTTIKITLAEAKGPTPAVGWVFSGRKES